MLYVCRHDNEKRAVALFDRAQRWLVSTDQGALLGDSVAIALAVLQSLSQCGFKLDRSFTISVDRP